MSSVVQQMQWHLINHSGLPDGVEGQYTPRQQVSEITIGNG